MRRQTGTNALVLLAYAAVSFLYFGLRIAPHPGRYLVGSGRDPQIFVWSFAWWPHAIEAWQNPFITRAVYAPDGDNLAWATTVPGLAIVFWPFTALFGPAASSNLAALLMPALCAWTAYLLCRSLTGSLPASLVGGYLFGFSSYVLGQELGHLDLTAVFLVPLVALVTIRYVRAEIGGRSLAWRLGALLGLQLWISTEVAFTIVLALAISLGLSYLLVPSTRPRISRLPLPLLAGGAIAAILAAPLLWYALTDFQSTSINAPADFDGDLLNVLLPTRLIAAGGSTFAHISAHFHGEEAERGSYLGLPVLVIVIWYAISRRRSAAARFAVAALGVALVCSLGTALFLNGRRIVWLPWREVARLPLLDNVLPERLAVYAALTAAVIVALWMQRHRGLTGAALAVLAVLALVPDLTAASFRDHPERWAFFTQGTYKLCLARNENVAIFPFGFWGNSMLWQAEAGFWFRMPEGYLAPNPPAANLASDPTIRMLTYTTQNPTPDEIAAFARNKKVDRVVSVDIYTHPNATQMHRFGPVQETGGVTVAPACGYPSMQKGIHPTAAHPGGR